MAKTKVIKQRRNKGEGAISQRQDGTFTARLMIGTKDDGKPIIKAFYGKSRPEVLKKMDEYKLFQNKIKETGVDETKLPDFDKYITYWLNNVKSVELKDLSFDRLESTINNHIIPAIGYYKTNNITDEIIQTELINKAAKKMSYSSIKKIYDALNACFKYAVSRRNLRFNPMNTVSLPKRVQFETKEIEVLTEEDVQRLMDVADSKYSTGALIYRNGWAIILMIYSGLRMGEALALKWEDYDDVNQILNIRKNLALVKNRDDNGSKYKVKEQKTLKTSKSVRTIPVMNELLKLSLQKLKETSINYIISTKDGKPIRPRNFQNMFDSMLKDAGMSHKGLHTTRHTFASRLFRRGADVKSVSELLGHADTRITYNTYIHLIQEQKNDVMKLLN